MRSIRITLAILLLFTGWLPLASAAEPAPAAAKPAPAAATVRVRLTTTMGEITLELDRARAPLTVANFLLYVDDGHYDGTIFHRVIPGFMIQGGGYDVNLEERETRDPIKNEADNGLTNDRGTIAMARTAVVDSATSQFFINVADNRFLNHNVRGYGYAVFGRVIEGMDIVTAIENTPTHSAEGFDDLPVTPVVLTSAKRLND